MRPEEFAMYVRLLPVGFLLWVAWFVARAPFPPKANRVLGTFFLLVALGFASEFLLDLFGPESESLGRLFRAIGLALGLADPLVIVYFSTLFPAERRLPRALWWALGLVQAGLFAASPFHLDDWRSGLYPQDSTYSLLQVTDVDVLYLAAFLLLLLSYRAEDRRFMARQLRFLVIGIGFAAISRTAALAQVFVRQEYSWWYPALLDLGAAIFLLIIVLLAFGRLPTARGESTARTLEVLGFLLVGFFVAWGLLILPGAEGVPFALFSQFYSLRWLAVAAVVGVGVLRYQLFDYDLRPKDAMFYLASLFVATGAAVGFGMLLDGRGVARVPALLGGLGLAGLVVLVSFVVDRALRAKRGPQSLESYGRRRLEMYEATLEFALRRGQLQEPERRQLETLREIFEITREEHDRLVEALTRRPRLASQASAPSAPGT